MKTIVGILLYFCIFSLCTIAGSDPIDFSINKNKMVDKQIIARGVTDRKVLAALRQVDRHLFIPFNLWPFAYEDRALPIGYGATISQPYLVACMTEALEIQPTDSILEIGTGSGYQAAVLSRLAKEVYTIEIIEPLAKLARDRLATLGYVNVQVKFGDGYLGWPDKAPFDKIIVTAAPPEIPAELIKQLKVGGKMIVPVGESIQSLYLITKTKDGFEKKELIPVTFVPMIKKEK